MTDYALNLISRAELKRNKYIDLLYCAALRNRNPRQRTRAAAVAVRRHYASTPPNVITEVRGRIHGAPARIPEPVILPASSSRRSFAIGDFKRGVF